jgi:hypothetical protein
MPSRFLSWIRDLWREFVTSKYVKALEAEVERLRAENRALMNSILGIAGVPPIVTGDSGAAQPDSSAAKADGAAAKASGAAAGPIRRRSWQQVNRALEIEAARKGEEVASG